MNPLHKLLPKVHSVKEPKDRRMEARLKLREYFLMFHKRNMKKKEIPIPPKFTLFKEPIPYLTIYEEGDQTLPLDKIFYTNFRTAYRMYMNALKEHKRTESKKNRISLLV